MTDSELLEFTADFRGGILDGDSPQEMCFAVCAPLEPLLNMFGCEAMLVSGVVRTCCYETNHFWLELPDGRILDPTADQFNECGKKMPAVYLGEKPEWYVLENKNAGG